MSHAQTKYNVQLSLVLIQQLGLQNRIANALPEITYASAYCRLSDYFSTQTAIC